MTPPRSDEQTRRVTTTATRFLREIQVGTERLKREISYNPTYFNRMVGELGPVEATRRLVLTDAPSDGFAKLWEHGRLGMTVEALAILPWYAELFDGEVLTRARRRLEDHGFDIDRYLGDAAASPPGWWPATDHG